MNKTLAHSLKDQKVIDDLSKRRDDLDKTIHDLQKNYEKINKKFDEYKSESKNAPETNLQTTPKKKPSAVKGHKGYHRAIPYHIYREVTVSITQCPHFLSDLSRTMETRIRIIEDILVIKPVVIRYMIERRYYPKCRNIVEPEIKDALPNAPLSLRSMLVIVYMKTVESYGSKCIRHNG